MKHCFEPADILLPDDTVEKDKWAVIACDQFTSQPDYWDEVTKYVGDSPSALNVVFPEIYLGGKDGISDEKRIENINSTMKKYLSDNTLKQAVTAGYVFVERTTESGVRLGIVGKIDLDTYDFDPKNKTLIRATEGTVLSRIPPRVKIRQNASIELPHVMLLVDDPQDKILGDLQKNKDSFRKLYDTDLMAGGGHITGYAIEGADADAVTKTFADKEADCGGFLFAVGDGNHSLATAKTCWENIKGNLTEEERQDHPARYVLVEICNLHSNALEFKPIHRLICQVKMDGLLEYFKTELEKQGLELTDGDEIVFCQKNEATGDIDKYEVSIKNRGDRLPVEILQNILDDYLSQNESADIDYIHGDDALNGLVEKTGGCGIFLQSIEKNTLFAAINAGGVLPRKTFSIGEANEKRYYMEAKRI